MERSCGPACKYGMGWEPVQTGVAEMIQGYYKGCAFTSYTNKVSLPMTCLFSADGSRNLSLNGFGGTSKGT
jgi:hypothetical protein